MSNNSQKTILEAHNIKVDFKVKEQYLRAVDNVSFNLKQGEILGLVGESGCGKSTLGRAILQLIKPTSGTVLYNNIDLTLLSDAELRKHRQELQIIFQDPLAALNPRMTVGQIIAEPLYNHVPKFSKKTIANMVMQVMSEVGLIPEHINRYPHEFSGGQCQRIGIARALIVKPKIIVCDEPVSALDVSIQAQIVNLLKSLQKKYGLSLIFIAHDLSIVRHISDRIMVMYLGKIIEFADADAIYMKPKHPYTKALLSAVPIPDPRLERSKNTILLTGELPSPINPPSGCRFRTRCSQAENKCTDIEPVLTKHYEHEIACHLYE
jgi:oligopeptide transport system ATP-binding protein